MQLIHDPILLETCIDNCREKVFQVLTHRESLGPDSTVSLSLGDKELGVCKRVSPSRLYSSPRLLDVEKEL